MNTIEEEASSPRTKRGLETVSSPRDQLSFKIISPRKKTTSPESTVMVTIGRMNPPTPGHLLLILRLIIAAARQNLTRVFVILSYAQDEKNPIHCWEKRDIYLEYAITRMKTEIGESYVGDDSDPGITQEEKDDIETFKGKIRNMEIVIICMDDPEVRGHPIPGAINYILGLNREANTLKLFVGEDRKKGETSDFGFIGQIINNRDPRVEFEEVFLPRTEMENIKTQYKSGDLTDLAGLPPEAMSASLVRAVVENDDKPNFLNLYRDKMYLKEKEIQELYGVLREEMLLTKSMQLKKQSKRGGKKTQKKKKNRKTQKRKNRKNKKTEKRKKRSKRSKRSKM